MAHGGALASAARPRPCVTARRRPDVRQLCHGTLLVHGVVSEKSGPPGVRSQIRIRSWTSADLDTVISRPDGVRSAATLDPIAWRSAPVTIQISPIQS